MKHLTIATLLILASGCKNANIADKRVSASSQTNKGNAAGVTVEKNEEVLTNGKPIGPGSLLGTWATPCGTFNQLNKTGTQLYARQGYSFEDGSKLTQFLRVYTDAACGKIANPDELKAYYTGLDLPAEEVASRVTANLNAKVSKTYNVAQLGSDGTLAIDLVDADGSIFYTTIAVFDDHIVIASECSAAMQSKGLCAEIKGDKAENRATKMEAINSLDKILN